MHKLYIVRLVRSGRFNSPYYAGWVTESNTAIMSHNESDAVTYEYRENADQCVAELAQYGYTAYVESIMV